MTETVGDLLEDMDRARGVEPAKPKIAPPFVPATLPDTPPLPAPGIYFGMPEDDYFALPALSASGVKDMCASPMLYWARQTWLSEAARKREAERAAKSDERAFRTIGKAYHCRLLEGAEEYAKRFAVELSAAECEGALESTDQIKAAIVAQGNKPISRVFDKMPDTGQDYERAARKEDWIRQLLAGDPDAKVLSELRRKHGEANAGKAFIPFDAHEQIEIAARMIEGDDALKHALRGGYPEVTLIWYCAETGVPMKARCDRLKLKAIVDLKSIGNERGLPIELAINNAIASYHYNIQPSVYCEGAQAVKSLIRGQGGINHDWAFKWAAETEEPEFWFLFQQKGIAPVSRLLRWPGAGVTRKITDEIVRSAKRRWLECSQTFGLNPWIDRAEPYDLNDDDIPNRTTENLRAE